MGRVVDGDGVPLPGATVLEKGTSNGAVTDLEGKFALTVADDAVLRFSFMGYKTQEISVKGHTFLDIVLEEDAVELPSIRSSVDLYHYFLPQMQDLFHEECYVLLMNQACRILDKVLVSKGGLTETAVDIRLILREALLRRAPVIALCHNHPSGQVRPSMEDDRLTDRLQKACRMMNIRLLDHIIVAEGGFYSYCEEGKLV